MKSPILVVVGLVWAGAVSGNPVVVTDPVVDDWANPPMAIVAEKVELTVGRDMSMVSGRYLFQYIEAEDAGHQARLYIHYPLYVEKGLGDWQEIAAATDLKLRIGGQEIAPTQGRMVPPDFLSDYPLPDDAAVAMLTFEVPRSLARLRFEATITHLQPNFHYHGTLLAAYTPWLPKSIRTGKMYDLDYQDFAVHLKALSGVALKRFTTHDRIPRESATEVEVVPEHRKTIAVEILPAAPPPAADRP